MRTVLLNMRSFKHLLNPVPDFLFQPWIYQLQINLCENWKKKKKCAVGKYKSAIHYTLHRLLQEMSKNVKNKDAACSMWL